MSLWARKISVNTGDSFAVKLRFMPTRQANTSSTWVVVKRLYEQAVELPRAEREAFLMAAETDDSVRAEVRSLLAHDPDQTGHPHVGFLNDPAAIRVLGAPDRTGEHLGAWQIARSLGTGGMGDVFEARRADGSYEGRAAVKLLKHGMTSPAVLQRFAHERQALARLHHPHIATLLDAGLSGDGLPYFVMEFVDGVPIDEAVRGMNLGQRLGLFLQLTQAVSHAHQNLLVHGDLKPGNVLVTTDGQVKLLDFGIAMALDPSPAVDLADRDRVLARALPFTPNYASPEQVRGEAVGTSTDIYSLGVLLYQLLTGVRPTGRDATTPAQAARSVLDEAPTRPSSLPDGVSADPHWLRHRKHLSGDLDAILLMALEKSVERRYASVEAMTQDIMNFLSGHPVSARSATLAYVARKFLGRHRLVMTMGSAAIVGLCATTGLALWQAGQAEHERRNAQRHLDDVRSLARSMIFDVNDALLEGITPGRTALVKVATQYLGRRMEATDLSLEETLDLVDTLRRLADVEGNSRMENLGNTKSALSRYSQALALLERAADVGRNDVRWWSRAALVRRSQTLLLRADGKAEASTQSAAIGSQMVRQAVVLDPKDMKLRRLLCDLKVAQADGLYAMDQLPSLGRLSEALLVLQEAVACADELRQLQPEENANTTVLSSALARLARGSLLAGQLDQGVSVARRNDGLMSDLVAKEPNNPTFARFASIAKSLLGYALIHTGHAAQGANTLAEGVDAARRQWHVDPKNARARSDFVALAWTLGEALLLQDEGQRALAMCSEAQAALGAKAASGADLEQRLQEDGLERCIAEAWLLQKQPQRSLELVDGFLQRIKSQEPKALAEDKQRILQSKANGLILKARVLQRLGQTDKALEVAAAGVVSIDALLNLDAANTETQGDAAHVRTLASALGSSGVERKTAVQCGWARQADATFSQLAQSSRLNLEYAVDKKQAQAQVRRCEALPG